jgi:hypothetical protein
MSPTLLIPCLTHPCRQTPQDVISRAFVRNGGESEALHRFSPLAVVSLWQVPKYVVFGRTRYVLRSSSFVLKNHVRPSRAGRRRVHLNLININYEEKSHLAARMGQKPCDLRRRHGVQFMSMKKKIHEK